MDYFKIFLADIPFGFSIISELIMTTFLFEMWTNSHQTLYIIAILGLIGMVVGQIIGYMDTLKSWLFTGNNFFSENYSEEKERNRVYRIFLSITIFPIKIYYYMIYYIFGFIEKIF